MQRLSSEKLNELLVAIKITCNAIQSDCQSHIYAHTYIYFYMMNYVHILIDFN